MAELVGVVGPFILVMCVNAVLFLGQFTMMTINPSGYNVDLSNNLVCSIGTCGTGGYNSTLPQTPQNVLGSTTDAASPTTGTTFTDVWKTVRSLFTGAGSVLGFIWGMVSAPFNAIMTIFGTSAYAQVFAYGIGVIWYGYSLLVIVMFVRGG